MYKIFSGFPSKPLPDWKALGSITTLMQQGSLRVETKESEIIHAIFNHIPSELILLEISHENNIAIQQFKAKDVYESLNRVKDFYRESASLSNVINALSELDYFDVEGYIYLLYQKD